MIPTDGSDTAAASYTHRLTSLEGARWKRLLDVQAPYRWNLRRLAPGLTLDIGCGLGRNLAHLGGNGVGVDHNPQSIAVAQRRGFAAFLPDEFRASTWNQPAQFDSLLFSHVAEHMRFAEAVELLRGYLPLLRPQGQLIVITPQEAGYRSDATHVEFFDFVRIEELLAALDLRSARHFSFPFPRSIGRLFKYNEFVVIAKRP